MPSHSLTPCPTPARNLVHLTLTPPAPASETTKYAVADAAVISCYRALLDRFPLELGWIADHEVKIIFKKTSKKQSAPFWFKSKVFPEEHQLLHPYAGLIILDEKSWNEDPARQDAILAEAIDSFVEDEDGVLKIEKPDVVGRRFVLKTFGDYKHELQGLGGSQLALELSAGKEA